MSEVTRILNQMEEGDPSASEKLLPLVYDELRALARQKLAKEKPGQTLQATALVHEAFVRLVEQKDSKSWDGCPHFFAATAEAMRRILVERARRRNAEKHGGNHNRVEFADFALLKRASPAEIVALNDLLERFAEHDPEAAQIVKLKIFADFSVEQAGEMLGMSRANAYRHWVYARAWLKSAMLDDESTREIEN